MYEPIPFSSLFPVRCLTFLPSSLASFLQLLATPSQSIALTIAGNFEPFVEFVMPILFQASRVNLQVCPDDS
jgi:hypothetical protein